VLPSMVITD
jgi:hypothetical protein